MATISKENVEKQQENFDRLLAQFGKADAKEIDKVLSQRENVQPEAELTPETIASRQKSKTNSDRLQSDRNRKQLI